ncbi:MAG TPA: universal stress protein [Gemmatimonadaceae bacterium]|nr:universal stress protein [Gemmatimonadaceae bacterium]
MYKVILVPTEGGDLERPAINLAVQLAQRLDAELRLVRVETAPVAVERIPGKSPLAITENDWHEARLDRQRKLDALGAQLRALGRIRVVTSIEDGIVNRTLVDYARRSKADLIVMSSHLRGGLKRLTLGSVTDYLIRNSDIPVLIAKPSLLEGEDAATITFDRFVVTLDGSAVAEQIMPHVSTLASALKASVNLLRVLTPQTYSQQRVMQPGLPWWDEDMAAANNYLAGIVKDLEKDEIKATKHVMLAEDIPSAIVDYALRVNADLIAIATSGAGGFKRLFLGSVADRVTRQSPISMLVFHALDSAGRSTESEREAENVSTVQQE